MEEGHWNIAKVQRYLASIRLDLKADVITEKQLMMSETEGVALRGSAVASGALAVGVLC